VPLSENSPENQFKSSSSSSSSSIEEEFIENEATMCKSTKVKINPNDLARSRGYTIIDDVNFQQSIEVDQCDKPNTACNVENHFKKSLCKQKFTKIQLRIAKNNAGQSSFVDENFEIPSVCVCVFYNRIS
jgi:hypothetical protein